MKKIIEYLLAEGFKPKHPTTSYALWFESADGNNWIKVSNYGREYKSEFTKFYTDNAARASKYSATKAIDIITWIQAQ